MIKKLIAATLVLVSVFGAGSAIAGPGCDYGRCFELVVVNQTNNLMSVQTQPGSCYEGEQVYKGPVNYSLEGLGPGQSVAIGIARVQGHGCNGHQGYFSLKLGFVFRIDFLGFKSVRVDDVGPQNFEFDNATGLALDPSSNVCRDNYGKVQCRGTLGPRTMTPGGWAQYTYTISPP